MKISQTENGLKIVEFMKLNGPVSDYNEFCQAYKLAFDTFMG